MSDRYPTTISPNIFHLPRQVLCITALIVLCFAVVVEPVAGQVRSTSEGGTWAAPTTWQNGVVPAPDDDVVITTGATVLIEAEGFDEPDIHIRTLRIEDGAVLGGVVDPVAGLYTALRIDGSLINEGTLHGGDAPYFFIVHAFGDIDSPGLFNAQLRVSGNGPRTIRLLDTPFPINTFGQVALVGESISTGLGVAEGKLTLERGAVWRIRYDDSRDSEDASLYDSFVSANFDNQGLVIGRCSLLIEGLYQCGSANVSVGLQLDAAAIESTRIETHGGRTHPRFPSRSVAGWWSLDWEHDEPVEGSFNAHFLDSDIWFLTDNPDNLSLRYSPDGGITWDVPDLDVSFSLYDEGTGIGSISYRGTVRPGIYLLEVEGNPPAGGQGGMIVSTRGREEIRIGAPNDYRIRIANTTGHESEPFLLSITLPEGMPITSFRPSRLPGEPRETWGPSAWGGPANEITLLVPSMAPQETRALDFVITPDDPSLCEFAGKQPQSVAAAPLGIGIGVALGMGKDYVVDLGANVLEEVIADPFTKDVRAPMRDALDRTNSAWSTGEKPVGSMASYAAENVSSRGWLRRGVAVVGVADNIRTVMDAVSRGQRRYEQRRAMGDPQPGPGPWGDYMYDYYYNTGHEYYRYEHQLEPVCSWDPNDKVGPGGVGEMGYVASAGVMDFRINFENLPEATAAAYRVVVVDTLDDVFDAATVEFGETSHEGFEITREGNVLRWEIEGIELPPNVNPPEGEGWVDFMVHTRPDLASGTVLRNRATITFDINDPIVTKDHVNTLDLYPPRTSMLSIPETTENRELVLRWDADDGTDGSGVQSTTVYVAIDDGPFEAFDAASADSMVFIGQPDTRYRFYAMSRDAVGNLEPGPSNIVDTRFEYAVSADQVVAPLVFELEQNYPNPFHSSTSISYTLPAPANIQLEVFDVLGRRVATLVSETQDRGQHVATWDASSLASGMYLYRLTSDNHTATRQLVIVR